MPDITPPIVKKPRRPSMTNHRCQSIAFVADMLRPKSDARIGRGTFWGTHPESAALIRAFVQWADELKRWREAR